MDPVPFNFDGGQINPASREGLQVRLDKTPDTDAKVVHVANKAVDVQFNGQALTDIPRLGKLELNRKELYDDKKGIAVNRTAHTVNEIYQECGREPRYARGVMNLLHQSVIQEGLIEMEKQVPHKATHCERTADKASSVTINQEEGTFSVKGEVLQEVIFINDIEAKNATTYYKFRSTVEGKLEDLGNRDSDKLIWKYDHTKTYSTEQEARGSKYGGFFSFNDSKIR